VGWNRGRGSRAIRCCPLPAPCSLLASRASPTSCTMSSISGGGGSSGGGSQSSFFEEVRSSDVVALQRELSEASATRDAVAHREAVKRVIAYMTLGVDVAPLITPMIMAANTTDLVQKKLVYQFLCFYSDRYPPQTMMCINTLLKDMADTNPMVRGLALRALCSLRVPSLLEYILPPLLRVWTPLIACLLD